MNELNRNEMNVSTIELLMEAGLTPEEITEALADEESAS